MHTVAVHRDKATFGEDVKVCRTERWIDSDPEQIKAMERAFFTVSLKRICIASFGHHTSWLIYV